jgi:hypothetical protein
LRYVMPSGIWKRCRWQGIMRNMDAKEVEMTRIAAACS